MKRYTSLIVLNSSVFCMMFGVGMIVALLPQRILDLTDSVSHVGYLASVFSVPFVLCQIPAGMLADRFGFRLLIGGGYLLCSLSGLLYYFSDTSGFIFLGRLVQGIGEVPIWATAPALLSIRYCAGKGKAMGFYNAAMHLGLCAGSLAVVFVCHAWRNNESFLLFSGASLVGGLAIALTVENPEKKNVAGSRPFSSHDLIRLMNCRVNRILLLGILLYGAGYGSFITVVPAFLIRDAHAGQEHIGVFFTLFYIAVGVSQAVAGPLSDRKGRKAIMITGLAISGGGLAVFPEFRDSWRLAILVLSSFGLGIFCVAAMAFFNERVSGSHKGTVSGAFYFSWGIGYFLGPMIIGNISTVGGFQMGFRGLSILILLEAAALVFAMARSPHLPEA